MTDLKTLNDLKYKPLIENGVPNLDLSSEQLKAEAIKWIKDYERKRRPMNTSEEVWEFGIGTAIDFIKTFFNITEEDLN